MERITFFTKTSVRRARTEQQAVVACNLVKRRVSRRYIMVSVQCTPSVVLYYIIMLLRCRLRARRGRTVNPVAPLEPIQPRRAGTRQDFYLAHYYRRRHRRRRVHDQTQCSTRKRRPRGIRNERRLGRVPSDVVVGLLYARRVLDVFTLCVFISPDRTVVIAALVRAADTITVACYIMSTKHGPRVGHIGIGHVRPSIQPSIVFGGPTSSVFIIIIPLGTTAVCSPPLTDGRHHRGTRTFRSFPARSVGLR